jgi:hypothetical protein
MKPKSFFNLLYQNQGVFCRSIAPLWSIAIVAADRDAILTLNDLLDCGKQPKTQADRGNDGKKNNQRQKVGTS